MISISIWGLFDVAAMPVVYAAPTRPPGAVCLQFFSVGEITKEQHEQMRSDLETSPSSSESGEES